MPQINKDIAGFHVSIRNSKNQIIVEHHIPYDYRSDHINGTEICQVNCQHLELCVLSKNSHGSINRWYDKQCINLPNNIEYIQGKYTRSEQIFVIYSIRSQNMYNNYNVLSNSATSVIHTFGTIFSLLLLHFLN